MKKLLSWILTLVFALSPVLAMAQAVPGNPAVIPEGLEIDWNARYPFEKLEKQMDAIASAYPEYADKYAIGRSWQERLL